MASLKVKRRFKHKVSNTGIIMLLGLDILVQFFIRLPIKCIAQLKSVCKYWNYVISNAEFTKLHRQYAITDLKDESLLHMFTLSCSYTETKDIERRLYTFKIVSTLNKSDELGFTLEKPVQNVENRFNLGSYPVGSSNGLICFITRLVHKELCLWNPTTNEYYYIKGPSYLPTRAVPLYWGFGYDPSSDDYKIVLIGKMSPMSQKPFARIFKLRSNQWRSVECPTRDKFAQFVDNDETNSADFCCAPILVGHTLYWQIEGLINPTNLLAFDLTNESLGIVPLASHDRGSSVDFFICQLKQCLCACWIYKNNMIRSGHPRFDIDIQMMECNGNDKVWKSLFKFKGLELECSHQGSLFSKLFELKEHDKYLLSCREFTDFVVVDPRGQHKELKSYTIGFSFYSLDCVQSLACPVHYVNKKPSPSGKLYER